MSLLFESFGEIFTVKKKREMESVYFTIICSLLLFSLNEALITKVQLTAELR